MSGIWNPFDNNGLSFSNGNLTVTNLTGSGVWYTCRATPFFEPSNRVYAEFTASNVGVSDSAVYLAVMTGNAALSLPGLTDANSVGYNQNGSTTYNGSGATLATWTTGNTICVAVDGTAGKVWWRVNNGNWNNDGSALSNPTTNVGGISCPNIFSQGPVYFGVSIHTINYAITGNFNGTFSYSIPSGFSALPAVTATQGNAIFAAASTGSLGFSTTNSLLGVSGVSSGVGTLLPTTSAIRSVGATGATGLLQKSLTLIMSSAQGNATASFGSIATATTIYNYEGFDHENAQIDLAQGIITSFVNCTASISTASPYNSGNSLAVTVPGGSGYAIYNCGANTLTRAVLGVMTQSNIYANAGTDVGFVLTTIPQVFCRMSGGNILVYSGSPSSPTLIKTLLNVIPAIGWFYLEMDVTIAPATGGSLTIYVNGAQIASLTSINTSATGSFSLNGVLLGGITPSGTSTSFMFDDVYVARSALGPIRVNTLFPSANGNLVQFLTSGATIFSNWQEVDEQAMDFDTTYNFSSTFALIDEFMTTDLPVSTSSVVALKVTMAARKDSDSARAMSTLLLSNATTVNGVSVPLTNNYAYYSDLYLIDPNTSTTWTASGINATQIGYKIR